MDGNSKEIQTARMTMGSRGVTERGHLPVNPMESHKDRWPQNTAANWLKPNLHLRVSESAMRFSLLSVLTFPYASPSARREVCPLLVLPMSCEHIQSSEDAARERRRTVSIEKWGREPDCTRIKEGVGGEETAAVTSE